MVVASAVTATTVTHKSKHYNTIRPIRWEILEKVFYDESNSVSIVHLGKPDGFPHNYVTNYNLYKIKRSLLFRRKLLCVHIQTSAVG
ncbi:UNVERIFIED_CONTAM: hypothetical protein PYX00_000338 [Menopon gallinae]|uniref:Uncharacterized protein n=1 Tax=Menopon gallinae TaxID=328185 RepID=A0AAW2I857_9NEOP